jgi:hypothetical protein
LIKSEGRLCTVEISQEHEDRVLDHWLWLGELNHIHVKFSVRSWDVDWIGRGYIEGMVGIIGLGPGISSEDHDIRVIRVLVCGRKFKFDTF